MMSLLILGSIVIGATLIGAGILRRMKGDVPQWQGGALIATGLFLQLWWVLLVALVFVKFFVLREDT
jgi:hypothetical protein